MDRVDVVANSENEEDKQMARVLTTLIWTSWGVYLFVIATGLFYHDWRTVFVTLAGCALLSVPLVLLKRLHLRASGLVLMLIVLGTVTFIATVGQGIRDLAILSLPIILIFAGMALDRKYFIICVGLTLVAICWLVFGETFGWFSTQPFIGGSTNWFLLVGTTIILLVAALSVDLLATNMRRNLAQAQREIAQRQQAEEKLIEGEARFRTILENIEDGFYEVDTAGNLTFFNPAQVRILGRPENELMGMNNRVYMTPEAAKAVYQIFNRVFRTGIPEQTFEWEFLRPDGMRRTVEASVSPIKAADGTIRGFRGIMRDTTERRQAEHDNRERLKELQAFFHLSKLIEKEGLTRNELFQEYVSIFPKSWQYPEIACARMVIGNRQFSSNNFKESAWMQSSPIKVNGSIEGRIEVGYLEERPEEGEGPFLNEERMLMDAIAERLGHFIERKQAEESLQNYAARLEEEVCTRTDELRKAQEQLVRREKLSVLGQMAGSVGHELRNPLGVINTSIYYLKLVQPEAGAKIKQHLGIIEQEVQNADKIIGDLLDFARIKSVEREPVSVAELVQRVMERFPAPASVKVMLKIPTDLPMVFADPRQVEQVLGNLVTNACQAMVSTIGVAKGGKLTVRGDCVVAKNAPRNDNSQQWVRIAVKDTGTGITPENMPKLFEPLFTTKVKGIGLGLMVSQKLAEANGGRIEVESQAGKGSTFTVYLPVQEVE